jgi:hypothetical protein
MSASAGHYGRAMQENDDAFDVHGDGFDNKALKL